LEGIEEMLRVDDGCEEKSRLFVQEKEFVPLSPDCLHLDFLSLLLLLLPPS